MTTELATRSNGAAPDFTREQIDLIKQTVARDTTDAQLKLLLYTASARGLDPLLRQIHGIVRSGQMAIQVGIDGLRLIADRTGTYAGNDEPHFYQAADATYPERASVTVWKIVQGQRCGFTASARWSEFYPGEGKDGFMWRKMPHVMLGKVAESMALRKAFPHETSGLYIHEEMQQADGVIVQPAQPAPAIRMVGPVTAEVEIAQEGPAAPALDIAATLTYLQKLPPPDAYSRQQRDSLKRLCDERLPAEAARYGLELPAREAGMDPAAWAANALLLLAERDDSKPF